MGGGPDEVTELSELIRRRQFQKHWQPQPSPSKASTPQRTPLFQPGDKFPFHIKWSLHQGATDEGDRCFGCKLAVLSSQHPEDRRISSSLHLPFPPQHMPPKKTFSGAIYLLSNLLKSSMWQIEQNMQEFLVALLKQTLYRGLLSLHVSLWI